MSRITPDSFTKVHVVDTIASPTLVPTIGEINAGDEVTAFITPAGIDLPEEGTDADSSDISSARDFSVPATIGGTLTAEFYRDDGTGGGVDTAWTTQARLTITHLVVARFGGTGTDNAILAGDTVEVYPVRVSQRSNNRVVRGEVLRFTATYALRGDPNLAAVVAA
jgi:hypothetical protein